MIDQELLEELQYALLEPPDGGQSWPSDVWTRDDVLDAVNQGCRQIVRDTLAITTWLEQTVLPNALSVSMPADWMTTAHLVFRTFPQQTRMPLTRVDALEADCATPGWEATVGAPIGYCDLDTNTLELRLVPTPTSLGVLENLYVAVPAAVNGNGLTVPVPDELLSGVKYSALGTLLRAVTRLQDEERARYCDERYQITALATELLVAGGA